MKYFVYSSERDSTAYHEFYNGKWDGKSFWSKDSICIQDDVLVEHKGFYKALLNAVPGYDPYTIDVEISKEAWRKIRELIPSDDIESLEMYEEASVWARAPFIKDGCFTILGL